MNLYKLQPSDGTMLCLEATPADVAAWLQEQTQEVNPTELTEAARLQLERDEALTELKSLRAVVSVARELAEWTDWAPPLSPAIELRKRILAATEYLTPADGGALRAPAAATEKAPVDTVRMLREGQDWIAETRSPHWVTGQGSTRAQALLSLGRALADTEHLTPAESGNACAGEQRPLQYVVGDAVTIVEGACVGQKGSVAEVLPGWRYRVRIGDDNFVYFVDKHAVELTPAVSGQDSSAPPGTSLPQGAGAGTGDCHDVEAAKAVESVAAQPVTRGAQEATPGGGGGTTDRQPQPGERIRVTEVHPDSELIDLIKVGDIITQHEAALAVPHTYSGFWWVQNVPYLGCRGNRGGWVKWEPVTDTKFELDWAQKHSTEASDNLDTNQAVTSLCVAMDFLISAICRIDERTR